VVQWAQYQINQLYQFYRELTFVSSNNGINTYRVPLTLTVSKTPLYVRIECYGNFPITRPNLVVLSRVVNKDIEKTSKVIMTPLLEKWDLYKHGSNLLAVIREINSRFDADPPIPEKLVE
jgi:hypothetical protein